MGRNLFRRIEVAFPVLDPELKARVISEGLKPYLADNRDAWELAEDASYTRAKPKGRGVAAQEELIARLADRAKVAP
jgi:polyphosphate kinase